jgi:hypothetical protein
LTENEKLLFDTEKVCHICEEPFDDLSQDVADHDHLTGKFRRGVHNSFNLNYHNPKFIPVIFQNLSGYDAHLFIKQFGEDDSEIKLIPNTEKKYISYSKFLKYNTDKI